MGQFVREKGVFLMKPPLKIKHINAIHSHNYLAIVHNDGTLIPYLCPECETPLLAREEGLFCAKCGYVSGDKNITYWGKMNPTGKIIPEQFEDE